jgi:outer membrane protein OmpA-like peptidoglycan-associated protein
MQIIPTSNPRWASATWLAAALWLTGCAMPVAPPIAPLPQESMALPQAVAVSIDHLIAKARSNDGWPASAAKPSLVIEPLQDGSTGQQTVTTRAIATQVAEHLRTAHAGVEVLPFRESGLSSARWMLFGKWVRSPAGADGSVDKSRQTLQLSLSELATGALVAQSSVQVRDDNLDNTPTAFFQDSPVLMAGAEDSLKSDLPSVEVARTTSAGARPAALIDQAMNAYDEGRLSDALALFMAAQKLPNVDMLHVDTGLYLVYSRIGQKQLARESFGRIAALGIARRSLAVKFLFEPGKVDFWADRTVSAPYQMWLEQIARNAFDAQACMKIVGHSSHTGTSEFNDRLSQERAARVGDLLRQSETQLGARMEPVGMGFRENLIGTGSDDARDALDRRVEFKFKDC